MRASLFIVSLPRSLSSLAYSAARAALDLREPVWTSSGEILNQDRFVTARSAGIDRKYVRCEEAPAARLLELLSQTVQLRGFAYKDVVQPFAAAAWLRGRDLPILRIRRPVAEVACAMLARGWLYPAGGAVAPEDVETALVDGLLAAEAALAALPGEVVDYEALISDESTLSYALQRLYPGTVLAEVHYFDERFERRREEVLQRHSGEPYRRLAVLERERRRAPTTATPV